MSAGDPSVIPSALDWLEEGRRVALATVIQTWGSAPRPVGSQLAIDGGGNFLGSVSGGCVEGEVIAEAEEVLLTAKPKTLEFGVEDGTAWKAGLAAPSASSSSRWKEEQARGRACCINSPATSRHDARWRWSQSSTTG